MQGSEMDSCILEEVIHPAYGFEPAHTQVRVSDSKNLLDIIKPTGLEHYRVKQILSQANFQFATNCVLPVVFTILRPNQNS